MIKLGRSRFGAAAGAGADAARVIVRRNGEIKKEEAPQKLHGRKGDILIWICENRSGVPIKVSLINFEFRLTKKPVQAVAFDVSDTVSLPAGETKIVKATITRQAKFPIEFVKYDVRVTGDRFTVLHDPDLEIKP